MKQGTGNTTSSAHKTEPASKAVSPAAAGAIGVHTIRHTSLPMYEGRGLKAPMQGQTNHHCGSQGKHK